MMITGSSNGCHLIATLQSIGATLLYCFTFILEPGQGITGIIGHCSGLKCKKMNDPSFDERNLCKLDYW